MDPSAGAALDAAADAMFPEEPPAADLPLEEDALLPGVEDALLSEVDAALPPLDEGASATPAASAGVAVLPKKKWSKPVKIGLVVLTGLGLLSYYNKNRSDGF